MKKILKSLFSLALALCLMLSLGAAAFADNWDIAQGNISVSATESGQNVSQGEVSKADSAPVISGTSDTNTVTISAAENATANVTFDNLDISIGGTETDKAPVSVTGDGNVNIELDGKNELKVDNTDYNHAALEKNNDTSNGTLTITDKDGNGSLNADAQGQGAGIGSSQNNGTSNINIEGGNVTAGSNKSGAAIGSGSGGSADGIHISGGTVKATSGVNGAAIGSGSSAGKDNHANDIVISGDAKVEANAKGGAAIGSGIGGSVGTVTISDNAQVTTNNEPVMDYGKYIGDGIGAGDGGSKENFVFDTSKLTSKGSVTMETMERDSKTGTFYLDKTTVIVGSYVPSVTAVAAASAAQPLCARYYVIIGNNAAWAAGSAEELAFKLNSDEVIKVLIDGEEVEFEVSENGEVVIAAEVLKALDPGTHEIEFIFADGSCEAVFNII